MNRKTKGALAIGAGAIILLGGAGSYALWGDTEGVTGGDISTGAFKLDCGVGGTWTDKSPTMLGGTAINATTDLMVPGDIWEYSGNCTPTFSGKNIKATLGVDLGTTAVPSINFTITTSVNGTNTTTTPIDAVSGTAVPVTVRVEFKDSTSGTQDTNTQVNVSGMQISLSQVRP